MKWLTLDKIKAQLRIEQDFTLEDDILEMYGESAEDSVLDIIRRSHEEVLEKYGKVPMPLVHASLMLVDLSYKERGPVSSQNLYQVPYAIDMKLKPYMKLADDEGQSPSGYAVLKDWNGKTIETADGMIIMVKK